MKNSVHRTQSRYLIPLILLPALLLLIVPHPVHATWPPSGWAYWLQDISLSTLASEAPDVVVMDYSSTGGADGEWTAQQITTLKDAGITVIAYLSIGEAEDYRFYWQNSWTTDPPVWLGPVNPDWAGNYKVRYWMSDWQAILYGTTSGDNESYLDRIIDQGFDGIYLDIVDAYYYWSEEAAVEDRFAAAPDSMVTLLSHLASYAESRGVSDFLIIPQNGEWLIEDCSSSFRTVYFQAMNGIGIEDLFYQGDADENNPWDPRQDSIDGPLADILAAGKVVLNVEYLTNQTTIDNYLSAARDDGYLPLATVRDLGEYHYYETPTSVGEAPQGLPDSPILTAYPNPFNGTVTVRLEGVKSPDVRLELFDVTGARVFSRNVSMSPSGVLRVPLEFGGLASGVYLLRAGNASRRITLLR